MKPLRLQLTEGEIERYRWLGQNVGEAVTDALFALRPGMTEAAMQAGLSERLLERRILPSVILTAADDRIREFRHAVPRDGVLERFGMLSLCARRWGLVAAITRDVYFGAMPAELEEKFAAVAEVSAALLGATREGATGGELFAVAQGAYAEQGYPGEEQMHHQGGATGYWEREWIARPGGAERVMDRQAMAWNPTLQGAKTEDTVLVRDGQIEILTQTPRLPAVETRCGGQSYRSAGVLRR
jgi:Xaa-Pro dipeptidase